MSSPPDLPTHVRAIVDEIETEIGEEPGRPRRMIEGDGTGAPRRRTAGSRRPSARSSSRSARTPIARAWPGTPERVHRMYTELTAGYHVDPERLINGAIFDVDYSEMVVVKDIPFYSLCEHHLLPFFGTAAVAYIPRGRVDRAVEDPAHRRDVRPPAPGPGAHDPADRRLPAGAARRRRASASSSRRPTCARSCAASASPARS